MADFELAVKYKPYIWFDQNEPFEITAVGYTVFVNDSQSMSFSKKRIAVDWKEIDFVIEYAIWFDYDIQHLYELEHIWIYVGKNGEVKDAEGSFHGRILRMILPDTRQIMIEDGSHLMVYSQPGKHAFLPEARLFNLITDLINCCNITAGIDGITVPKSYKSIMEIDQKEVTKFIKDTYSFIPSMKFERKIWPDSILMTWEQLASTIPDRINAQIELIKNCSRRS